MKNDEFIDQIMSTDEQVRAAAWQAAGPLGAPLVKPLASVMTNPDMEIARAAKKALWKIVRYAGRPGADAERKAVAGQLLELLPDRPVIVRREALWMLSEIGSTEAVHLVGALLSDVQTREDARAALERIPGRESIQVLQAALETVAEEFRPAIAQSLRVRGVKVSVYPSQKLVPTRPTQAGKIS